MKKLLVLGFAVALACAAYAYPTLIGSTGLVVVPTADVAQAGQFNIAADWWYLESTDAIIPLRVVYGINDQFEIGAAFITAESSESDIWALNAKYVLPLALCDAKWAVTGSFVDAEDSDSSFSAALSATKEYNKNFKGTASLIWAEESNFFLDEEFNIAFGAEAGFENGLTVVAEYVNFMPGAELNVAARYPLTTALTAQLGYTFVDAFPFIGVNYAIGGTAE